ncbi:hypothetical protein TrLO_g13919 [Triparma laevis f. longispina]|nr:hypothetical protein TrLO_g13919 [Triparma laevis f. longispina]
MSCSNMPSDLAAATSNKLPPPPPPAQELIRWKRSTIQHRNHYNPATKANPERCGHHRKHHPDDWSHLGKGEKKEKRKPLHETIQNLLVVEEDFDPDHHRHCQHEHHKEAEHLQRHLGPLDSHGKPQNPSLPKPPMHKSEIPKNARKPVHTCVGQLGGGSGVKDPRHFTKAGSGSKGPVVGEVVVSKPNEEPTKWTRPLDENFVPKMGKPKPGAPRASGEETVHGAPIPKRDFMKENKGKAVEVVQKKKSEVPKTLNLGSMPKYLEDRRAKERFEFAKSETERIERRSERKQQRRLERRQRRELLEALTARRQFVLVQMNKNVNASESRRKRLEVELTYLDKDITKLEGSGVILISEEKKKERAKRREARSEAMSNTSSASVATSQK